MRAARGGCLIAGGAPGAVPRTPLARHRVERAARRGGADLGAHGAGGQSSTACTAPLRREQRVHPAVEVCEETGWAGVRDRAPERPLTKCGCTHAMVHEPRGMAQYARACCVGGRICWGACTQGQGCARLCAPFAAAQPRARKRGRRWLDVVFRAPLGNANSVCARGERGRVQAQG